MPSLAPHLRSEPTVRVRAQRRAAAV